MDSDDKGSDPSGPTIYESVEGVLNLISLLVLPALFTITCYPARDHRKNFMQVHVHKLYVGQKEYYNVARNFNLEAFCSFLNSQQVLNLIVLLTSSQWLYSLVVRQMCL